MKKAKLIILLIIVIVSILYLLLPRYNLYSNAVIIKKNIDLSECLKLRKINQQCIEVKDK